MNAIELKSVNRRYSRLIHFGHDIIDEESFTKKFVDSILDIHPNNKRGNN